jgi:hypothetical protein
MSSDKRTSLFASYDLFQLPSYDFYFASQLTATGSESFLIPLDIIFASSYYFGDDCEQTANQGRSLASGRRHAAFEETP